MAIKVGGTTVIDDSRALNNITSVDATTVAALGTAGIGGGGGIELTTSEAVVEGDTLALNFTTGKVDKVTRVGGSGNRTISVSGRTVSNSKDLIYIPEIDKWALLFHDNSTSPTAHYTVIGTQASTGDITWGTAVKVENVESNRDGSRMVYDPNVNRLLVVARMDNGSGKAQTYSISGTSLTKTAESNFEPSGINVNHLNVMNLHYHPASNKIICTYYLDSGTVPTCRVFTLGASSISVSGRQGPGNFSSGGSSTPGFGSNAGAGAWGISSVGSTIVFAYVITNFKAVAATISGTTLSFGSDIDLSSDTPGQQYGLGKCIHLSGSSTSNKFAAFFNYSNNGYYSFNFTVSGTTLSYVDLTGTEAPYNSGVPAVGYDPANDKGYIAWLGGGAFRANIGSVTDNFWTNTGTYVTISGTTGDYIMNGAYNPDVGLFTFIDNTNKYGFFAPQEDNYLDFIGVAKEAASANSTVKIANSGQVATGLSGLTAGNAYRIQYDGTFQDLGITENRSAFNGTQRDRVSGRALTSTTMLMINDFMSS